MKFFLKPIEFFRIIFRISNPARSQRFDPRLADRRNISEFFQKLPHLRQRLAISRGTNLARYPNVCRKTLIPRDPAKFSLLDELSYNNVKPLFRISLHQFYEIKIYFIRKKLILKEGKIKKFHFIFLIKLYDRIS